MAISLNNINTRLNNLESVGVSYPDAQSLKVGKWIIKMGVMGSWVANDRTCSITFSTAFPSTCVSVVCQVLLSGNVYGAQTFHMNSVSRTGFAGFQRSTEVAASRNMYWIAIGYLISYRILNYAYAYIKSLRDFKAIIKSHSFCKLLSKISREVI